MPTVLPAPVWQRHPSPPSARVAVGHLVHEHDDDAAVIDAILHGRRFAARSIHAAAARLFGVSIPAPHASGPLAAASGDRLALASAISSDPMVIGVAPEPTTAFADALVRAVGSLPRDGNGHSPWPALLAACIEDAELARIPLALAVGGGHNAGSGGGSGSRDGDGDGAGADDTMDAGAGRKNQRRAGAARGNSWPVVVLCAGSVSVLVDAPAYLEAHAAALKGAGDDATWMSNAISPLAALLAAGRLAGGGDGAWEVIEAGVRQGYVAVWQVAFFYCFLFLFFSV
jgi:hypothetical protein